MEHDANEDGGVAFISRCHVNSTLQYVYAVYMDSIDNERMN